jgi:hypothetical protein
MPAEAAIEKRNRALIAFIAITGTRDGAVVTLRLKHFDMARNLVIQNPNEVKTKFSKRICAFLLPVDDRLKAIFLEWVHCLKTDLLFGNNDPLFPKTAVAQDENDCFKAVGLSRDFWANATPVGASSGPPSWLLACPTTRLTPSGTFSCRLPTSGNSPSPTQSLEPESGA